jgi:RHS repeat-associated protein
VRYASASLPTRYTYTGQYSYMDDPGTPGVTEGFGLMFYKARWYDPLLSRFAQADSIIPVESQGVQAWDRYAGMNNNPVRYNDPSGHAQACADGDEGGVCGYGANIEHIYKSFSKERGGMYGGLFAEYYAKLHAAHMAILRDDPYAQDYIMGANAAYQYAINYVPQTDFKLSPIIDPISAYRFAETTISLGRDFLAFTSWAFIPNPNGINGNLDHLQAVNTLNKLAKTEFFGQDVDFEYNKSIKSVLGIDRRPDVSVWRGKNLIKVYEAARVDQIGNFVAREQRKMYEYYEAGISYFFIAVK